VPANRDGLGPFYQDVIAVDPVEPWHEASAAYRLEVLARTLPFRVGGARLVPSNNNDVWRLDAGYLRVAWRGDRSRLAREAEVLRRLRGSLPVPEVLDCGGDDRLSWSLTAAMPGTDYERRCVQPAPAGLRDLAREVAEMLRTLHSWPVPRDLAEMLESPEGDPDPLRRAGCRFRSHSRKVLLVPTSSEFSRSGSTTSVEKSLDSVLNKRRLTSLARSGESRASARSGVRSSMTIRPPSGGSSSMTSVSDLPG
jgi:hypothetical protein